MRKYARYRVQDDVRTTVYIYIANRRRLHLVGAVTKNMDRGKKWTPRSSFRLRKTDRPCEKWAGVFPAAVVCPSVAKSDEDAAVEHLDLVDEVFIYLTESRYVDGCSAVRKRAIRKYVCCKG